MSLYRPTPTLASMKQTQSPVLDTSKQPTASIVQSGDATPFSGITWADIAFEHRFWLRILADHMQFILDKTATSETSVTERATVMQNVATQLLQEGGRLGIDAALAFIQQVKEFKQSILHRLLNREIKTSLSATLVSHMLSELSEYEDIVKHYEATGEILNKPVIEKHLLWLADINGHLDAISAELDGVELHLACRVRADGHKFADLHKKAVEFFGYLKNGVTSFPALQELTRTSTKETLAYLGLLIELTEMVQRKTVVGTLHPLLLDHMYREQVYYLGKLGTKDIEHLGDPTRNLLLSKTK